MLYLENSYGERTVKSVYWKGQIVAAITNTESLRNCVLFLTLLIQLMVRIPVNWLTIPVTGKGPRSVLIAPKM